MPPITNEYIDLLIERTLAGNRVAREQLFEFIWGFVARRKLLPLGPYSRDPDCRAEVSARVVGRFLDNDYRRLREYLARPQRCFRTLLHVVATRVAVDLARNMSQNIAGRSEPTFRWIMETELPLEHADEHDAQIRLHLLDVVRYMEACADPLDVELLWRSIQSQESWEEISRSYNLTPDAARQRVYRLRNSLRAWIERDAHVQEVS